MNEIATEPGEFKTVVIDTLDWIEPMLYAHVVAAAKKNDIKHIEDFGYGKGYVIAQNEARKLIVALDRANAAGITLPPLALPAPQGAEPPRARTTTTSRARSTQRSRDFSRNGQTRYCSPSSRRSCRRKEQGQGVGRFHARR